MRVGVGFYGLAPEGGGVHTFQGTLLEEMRRSAPNSRHEFVYYSAGGPSGEPDVIDVPTYGRASARRRSVEVLRQAQDLLNVPRGSQRTWFERSLDENEVEFVWFAANWAQDCGRPFMFTLFDLGHLVEPHFPELSANGEWERRQAHFERMRKASAIIVPNAAGRDQLLRHFPVEVSRVLCLPHPTPEFASRPDPFGTDDGIFEREGIRRPYLFYPAQFWAHKNHFNLLRSLALIDGYELVLVGADKGQAAYVRSLASELGVADRVHLLGFVEMPALISLYRQAHALVYLSFLGPENLPPLEAFALGCPVVASDVPGAHEQLGDAALRVPPTDPEAVAAAVRRLEDEKERARLVPAGRERAAECTVERYVAGVFGFLDAFEPVRRSWR